MKLWIATLGALVAIAGISSYGQTPTGAAQRPPARQTTPVIMMSPKASSPGWTGVHRPHTKLADVLARHKGQADWAETIVDDESLNAQWISMGPGKKTPRRMNGDTREWWIVQSGTLRFTVEGREPDAVVATEDGRSRHAVAGVRHLDGLDALVAELRNGLRHGDATERRTGLLLDDEAGDTLGADGGVGDDSGEACLFGSHVSIIVNPFTVAGPLILPPALIAPHLMPDRGKLRSHSVLAAVACVRRELWPLQW